MAIIQTKTKKENNNQQQKEIKENGQRKEKEEKTKYSDSKLEREETRPITFEVILQEQKFKPKKGENNAT